MLIQQTAKLGKVLEIPANSRANSSDFLKKLGSNSCMSKKMIIFATQNGNIPHRHRCNRKRFAYSCELKT